MAGNSKETGEKRRRKNAFFRYFELLINRFNKLVTLNIIYFLFILPLLSGLIVLALNMFGVAEKIVDAIPIIRYVIKIVSYVPIPVAYILFFVSILIYGPMTAGLTHVIRNYVEGKHAWYTELFTRARDNFKQGLVLGVVDILVLISFLMYMALDISEFGSAMKFYYGFMRVAATVIFFVYIYMRYYIYTLAVTFDLKLFAIYKNAAIFAVLGVINNTVATLVILLIIWTFTSTPVIDAVLILTLFFSLCVYTSMFATYPIIKKYMLKKNTKDAGPQK